MPITLLSKALLRSAIWLPLWTPGIAQSASYSVTKDGCNGAVSSRCITQNTVAPSLVFASQPGEFAFSITNTSGAAIQVLGYDMFTASVTNALEVAPTFVYPDASGPGALTATMPGTAALATGQISVAGYQGWFSTSVYPPPVVQPGEVFWVAFNAGPRISPPVSSTGFATGLAKYRQPNINNNGWLTYSHPGGTAIRIRCTSDAPEAALLRNTDLPRAGQAFHLEIRGGLSSTFAFLAWGLNTFSWNGLLLPFEMTPFGAVGCYLYTSTDFVAFQLLDAAGATTVTTAIPATPSLYGVAFVNQAMPYTAANSLGFLTSNLGRGVIGL
jgi:hypothetical protein